jgi:hypothetical protein
MGGFNFIFCVAENFIKTVGFDFIVSNANDFIKNSESSTLSTKNIKTSFLYPTATSNAESLCFQGFSVFIFVKNEKNENPQFFIGFFRLLMEFMTDVVRLSGGFFYVIRCVFL